MALVSDKGEIIKAILGAVLGAIGLAVVVGFFFFSEKVKVERSLVAAGNHCPMEKPKRVWGLVEVHPPSSERRTAVLIDATDRIPDTHRAIIDTWFEEGFTKTLIRFERVSIFEVRPQQGTPDPKLDEPHFDQCAPPVKANKWIENPRLVRQNFEQNFMKKKLDVIGALASQEEARWSPIIEVIEELFERYDRIVLVSDLMQNTPDCSLYQRRHQRQGLVGCKQFSLTRFNEKNLEVIYLKRNKISRLQGKFLLSSWRNFIESKKGQFSIEVELPTIQ